MTRSSSVQAAMAIVLAVTCLLIVSPARSDSFCFLLAQNYYEQIYCELQAKGRSAELPSLYDFRNNDEMTQALLLKQPARRAGLSIAMPTRRSLNGSGGAESNHPQAVPTPPVQPERTTAVGSAGSATSSPPLPPSPTVPQSCALSGDQIACGGERFYFVSNRANSALADDVFSPANRMALPAFGGELEDRTAVATYLDTVYPIYLEKMMVLGLAEATMTYRKFAAIFYDISGKGVSFSERLETMYHFLKKDKHSMAVRISASPPSTLAMSDCEAIGDRLRRCVHGGRNYLFARAGER